jgi:putative DNA primase/helicase
LKNNEFGARALFESEYGPLQTELASDVVSETTATAAFGEAESEGDEISDWPDPLPLRGVLPPVSPFNDLLLPDCLRALIVDVAERMQVPLDYPAAASVVTLAGAVNRRVRIQPKVNDTGWQVVPNLWGAMIGPPGVMKSPVMQAITLPLLRIESEWQKEWKAALQQYRAELKKWKLKEKTYKDQLKEAAKKPDIVPIAPGPEPSLPVSKRLIINDATPEKLHEIMSQNPAGIFVVRDELPGWLADLDKAGREGERALHLQAWSGDSSHTVDRIGRGTVYVEGCCESILGGIQPDMLKRYFGSGEVYAHDDGLIQRFQISVWPDGTHWRYVDEKPNSEAMRAIERALTRLVSLDANRPMRFVFSPEAQEYFKCWLEKIERQVRDPNMPSIMASHLSKYRSLLPSLALLFELIERATGGSAGFEGFAGGDTRIRNEVSLENAERASDWCTYLESHARRIYSLLLPERNAVNALADKILSGRLGQGGHFTVREVYENNWQGLSSPQTAQAAVNSLVRLRWVREQRKPTGSNGGRPSIQYLVNPNMRTFAFDDFK